MFYKQNKVNPFYKYAWRKNISVLEAPSMFPIYGMVINGDVILLGQDSMTSTKIGHPLKGNLQNSLN